MEDDLALEVVVLLGTVAGDQAAAELIVETGILQALVNLLNGELKRDVCCWKYTLLLSLWGFKNLIVNGYCMWTPGTVEKVVLIIMVKVQYLNNWSLIFS